MRRSKERGFSSWKMAWIAAALVAAGSLLVAASDNPPERIPSYVAWTPETIAAASVGDAFRGMLLAKRCEHCHGPEGFSAVGMTPNLAGMNRLAVWKELQDFRSHKRKSRAMRRDCGITFVARCGGCGRLLCEGAGVRGLAGQSKFSAAEA